MIGWNFPSNGGGLIRGVSEAGIQTFTGKEISSLARAKKFLRWLAKFAKILLTRLPMKLLP